MRTRARALIGASLLLAGGPLRATVDWPQFNLSPQHSGSNTGEIAIHPANVATLHVLSPYPITLAAIADGAPALLSGVTTPSGTKDLVFLTTKTGRLLALDAATGATVWFRQSAGPNYTTSSPAVDPGFLYVYSYGLDGKVHKYQAGDGTETTTGGWPQTATLKGTVEKGSSALAIATAAGGASYLYVANGGYPGDQGDYQGHVTTIHLGTGEQKVFNANCSDQTIHFVENGIPPADCLHVQTAIWARPGVVYDASLDRIFMSTGNGTYDGNAVGHEWGDSVFALRADGSGLNGNPLDTYTPAEFLQLDVLDQDLGSTAPAILPAPAASAVAHLGLQSGKDAQIRLLNLGDLSGLGGPGHTGGELQVLPVPQGGQVLTQPAVWVNPADSSTWAFVANDSGIAGLHLTINGAGAPALTAVWNQGPGGTSPVLANGMLFYASFGGMKALDPTTGTELWSDGALGSLHWQSPIVVGGRVFVTDEGSKLWAFGPTPEALSFYTLAPCRILDTRDPAGIYGGPALSASATRNFPLAGRCGIPADARAAVANVTVIAPGSAGDLVIAPAGVTPTPPVVSFAAGQTRPNNALLALTGNPLGAVSVRINVSSGTAHLALDVFGYFK